MPWQPPLTPWEMQEWQPLPLKAQQRLQLQQLLLRQCQRLEPLPPPLLPW